MKFLITFICILLFSTLSLAQEVTVQLPSDWQDTSTDTITSATDPQTGAAFYALTAPSLETALMTLDLTVTNAVETVSVTLPSGEWTQTTYIDGGSITIVWSQPIGDVTHVMVATAPMEAAQTLVPTIKATIASYQIEGAAPVAHEPIVYPSTQGEYRIGRVEYVWTYDKRELAVTVWYPAADDLPVAGWVSPGLAAAYADVTGITFDTVDDIRVNASIDAPVAISDTAFPVLVMSHGDGLFPALYTAYAESLASHGYVVFGVTHPYNAAVVAYPDGRVVTGIPEASAQNVAVTPEMTPLEIAEAVDKQGKRVVAIQAADVRFVLDQIEALNVDDGRFAGKLDVSGWVYLDIPLAAQRRLKLWYRIHGSMRQ